MAMFPWHRLRPSRLFCMLLLAVTWPDGISSTTTMASSSSSTSPAAACGGGFTIAGSVSTDRLARLWAATYQQQHLQLVMSGGDCSAAEGAATIVIDDSTSSTGADRVCGVRRDASAVDVAAMSRSMNRLEATTTNGWKFNCQLSVRKTVQIEFGLEGAALATGVDGPAAECLAKLGGLSVNQLRWMFSGMTEQQLIQEYDGWDASEVPYSDGVEYTRLWSELHSECQPVEISIVGTASSSPVHGFFADKIMKAAGENIDVARFLGETDIELLMDRLEVNKNAIGFLNIRYVLSEEEKSVVAGRLKTVPIREVNKINGNHNGTFVHPEEVRFKDSSYPLISRIYFNINDEESTWTKVRPFLDYAYSEQGTQQLLDASFWPIPRWKQEVMKVRAGTATAVALEDIVCGPEGSTISMAGSSTVFPVSQIWLSIYEIKCNVTFTLEGGGSSIGAKRVCGNTDEGSDVDIGNLSREWKQTEAVERDNDAYLYDCVIGKNNKTAIQIPVAFDGLTVVTLYDGAANDCVQILGGLSTDQLRWIYSNYTEDQLKNTGWDPTSIRNNDAVLRTPTSILNSDTVRRSRRWSEIDGRCRNEEIQFSGPGGESGTQSFFVETVLSDFAAGEGIEQSLYFGSEKDEELVQFVEANGGAISFFGYGYFYQNRDILSAVPIQNEQGAYVSPSETTIQDSSYNPLVRSIFMNLWNDGDSLVHTVPFVRFGLGQRQLISATGYIPVAEESAAASLQRLTEALDDGTAGREPTHKARILIGMIVVVLLSLGLGIVRFLLVRKRLQRRRHDDASRQQEKDCSSSRYGQEEEEQRPFEPSQKVWADDDLADDVMASLPPSALSYESKA